MKNIVVSTELTKTLALIGKKISAVNTLRMEADRELDAVIATAERMKADLGFVTTAATRGTKRTRNMSPEARQRIAEAARKRWAKYRKAKGLKAKGKTPIPKEKPRTLSASSPTA